MRGISYFFLYIVLISYLSSLRVVFVFYHAFSSFHVRAYHHISVAGEAEQSGIASRSERVILHSAPMEWSRAESVLQHSEREIV